MRRVLITGSRSWTDEAAVERALTAYAAAHGKFILIQGDCPSGADAIAKRWAIRNDYPHEDVPADWERVCDANCYHRPRVKNGRPYCPMAGHLRNQVMVDRGADDCLAFPIGDKASKRSRGTWDCMDRARRAGIPVMNLGIDQ